jgi:hypothetical protein
MEVLEGQEDMDHTEAEVIGFTQEHIIVHTWLQDITIIMEG